MIFFNRREEKELDSSPELKRGEFKGILLPLIENHFPDFQFISYKNQYYSFQRKKKVHNITVYEGFDIGYTLKHKFCSCSVSSRLNPFYIGDSGYNSGWINPHCDLLSLKKGTGVKPLEEAHYYHNGRIETITKVISEIITDLQKFGLTFLDRQIDNLNTNPLVIEGLRKNNSIDHDINKLKAEIESEQTTNGGVITRLKHPVYLDLKEYLQRLNGISKENRKEIPRLAYELIEILMYK